MLTGRINVTYVKSKEERRYARVKTPVKVKLPGDLTWTESAYSDVSGCGLLFDTARRMSIGDFTPLQFELRGSPDANGSMLFFAPAKIVWIAPFKGYFRTAVELLINDDMRYEIVKLLEIIKNKSIMTPRQTSRDALLQNN